MRDDSIDAEAIQIRLQKLRRDTQDVSHQLPDPVNLNNTINELESTRDLVARLETAENQKD